MPHKRAKAVGKLLFFDNKTTLRSIDRFGFNYLLPLSFALNTKMVNLHKGALNPKQTMNMRFPLMLYQESFFYISI